MKAKGKERITITIEKDLLEWLDRKVEEKIFANRSHGFEFLILVFKLPVSCSQFPSLHPDDSVARSFKRFASSLLRSQLFRFRDIPDSETGIRLPR